MFYGGEGNGFKPKCQPYGFCHSVHTLKCSVYITVCVCVGERGEGETEKEAARDL